MVISAFVAFILFDLAIWFCFGYSLAVKDRLGWGIPPLMLLSDFYILSRSKLIISLPSLFGPLLFAFAITTILGTIVGILYANRKKG